MVPLTGVRVEVMDGPKAGLFAMSDANGTYRLPKMPAGLVHLQGTKDGYEPNIETIDLSSIFGPLFMLATPPHTLWGTVSVGVGVPATTRVPGARLEIFGGPNANKVTFADGIGRYQFDDLVTSPPFEIRIANAGFEPKTYTIYDFRANQQRNFGLTPK